MPKKQTTKLDSPASEGKIVETSVKDLTEENQAKAEPKTTASTERVYLAHANLSSNGKKIASPGEEIVLSDSLAAHYNKYAPGSISEVL